MENNSVCMVVTDCYVSHFGKPINAKGKLIYNKQVEGLGFYIMDKVAGMDKDGFSRVVCTSRDVVPIDNNHPEESLRAAYRKSKTLGNVNPFLKIPLKDLITDFFKYVDHHRTEIEHSQN